jgi:hypothetical protein
LRVGADLILLSSSPQRAWFLPACLRGSRNRSGGRPGRRDRYPTWRSRPAVSDGFRRGDSSRGRLMVNCYGIPALKEERNALAHFTAGHHESCSFRANSCGINRRRRAPAGTNGPFRPRLTGFFTLKPRPSKQYRRDRSMLETATNEATSSTSAGLDRLEPG